jgi:hypothetical protein
VAHRLLDGEGVGARRCHLRSERVTEPVEWARVEVLWKSAYKRVIFPIKTDKTPRVASS